jgi:Cof subfamily protein (haloacid dehalogenase superfamily)
MRLVACDLDGTVVCPDGTITARTREALLACERAGIGVVFVTGRPPRWMAPVSEATGHRGVAICGNGAVVCDLGSGDLLAVRALSSQAALAAVRALRTVLDDATFAFETVSGFRREPDYLPMHDVALRAPVGTVEELLAEDLQVLKVLCRSRTRLADAMLALARPALAGLAEPVHSNAGDSMLEISALGVSKASTLAIVAAERGIEPADVVAFGDMPNDVPMLRWAGRGYAMANGHPEALAAADDVAPPCTEDGVAQVLEGLLRTRLASGHRY